MIKLYIYQYSIGINCLLYSDEEFVISSWFDTWKEFFDEYEGNVPLVKVKNPVNERTTIK